MVATEEELTEHGSKVLLENEKLYVRMNDGTLRIKMGDGITPVSSLPFLTVFDEKNFDETIARVEEAVANIEQYKGLELVGTITLYPYSTEDGSKLYQEVERSGDTVAVYYTMDLSDEECGLFANAKNAKFTVSTYGQDIAVNSDFVFFRDGDFMYYAGDMVDMVDYDVLVGDVDEGKAVYFKIDSVFKTVIDTFCAYSSDPLVIELYR
jgi:hypothetical protein